MFPFAPGSSPISAPSRRSCPATSSSAGTPIGAGVRLDPPVWLKPGDVVEVEVVEIGTAVRTAFATRCAMPLPPPGALPQELDEAERGVTQVEQFSLRHPDMTMEDCLRHPAPLDGDQDGPRGARVRGHKIGLTSRAMQQAVGIDVRTTAS